LQVSIWIVDQSQWEATNVEQEEMKEIKTKLQSKERKEEEKKNNLERRRNSKWSYDGGSKSH